MRPLSPPDWGGWSGKLRGLCKRVEASQAQPEPWRREVTTKIRELLVLLAQAELRDTPPSPPDPSHA